MGPGSLPWLVQLSSQPLSALAHSQVDAASQEVSVFQNRKHSVVGVGKTCEAYNLVSSRTYTDVDLASLTKIYSSIFSLASVVSRHYKGIP